MKRYAIPAILFLSLLLAIPAYATSLFDEEGCDLFTSQRAADLGDLVTIVIQESTSASNRTSTETGKSLNTDGQLSVQGFLQWVAGLPDTISPIEDITFTPSEEFEGEGRVSAAGTLTARVTATVIDVLPNGNLIVEGRKDITIAEDTSTLLVRGVVQTRDITVDNTILSTDVADLEILYEGEGIIADRQHDGILSRIFNFFF